MDVTDTITDHREEGATDGVPMLPVLPSATTVDEEGATDGLPTLPTLPVPPSTPAADEEGATDGVPTLPPAPVLPATPAADVAVALPMSLPPLRPSPAANATYGVMPAKPRAGEPSPAALQAAEQRRRAKKKRRTRRIAMLVVAIAIAALAGPPLARWIADGLDTAGSTKTESTPPTDDTD